MAWREPRKRGIQSVHEEAQAVGLLWLDGNGQLSHSFFYSKTFITFFVVFLVCNRCNLWNTPWCLSLCIPISWIAWRNDGLWKRPRFFTQSVHLKYGQKALRFLIQQCTGLPFLLIQISLISLPICSWLASILRIWRFEFYRKHNNLERIPIKQWGGSKLMLTLLSAGFFSHQWCCWFLLGCN